MTTKKAIMIEETPVIWEQAFDVTVMNDFNAPKWEGHHNIIS